MSNKKIKKVLFVILACSFVLISLTGCTFGFRTPDYIAFGWSPIAQEGAIWRSTDGVIVIDSRNYAINGYIVINGEKVRLLVEHEADISVADSNGMTAYDYAVKFGRTELYELLKP